MCYSLSNKVSIKLLFHFFPLLSALNLKASSYYSIKIYYWKWNETGYSNIIYQRLLKWFRWPLKRKSDVCYAEILNSRFQNNCQDWINYDEVFFLLKNNHSPMLAKTYIISFVFIGHNFKFVINERWRSWKYLKFKTEIKIHQIRNHWKNWYISDAKKGKW